MTPRSILTVKTTSRARSHALRGFGSALAPGSTLDVVFVAVEATFGLVVIRWRCSLAPNTIRPARLSILEP